LRRGAAKTKGKFRPSLQSEAVVNVQTGESIIFKSTFADFVENCFGHRFIRRIINSDDCFAFDYIGTHLPKENLVKPIVVLSWCFAIESAMNWGEMAPFIKTVFLDFSVM
jgi:hypothetical protein